MTLHLYIPGSVASSLRLPIPEIEPRLRAELALALYAQGILPFGKASELVVSENSIALKTRSLYGAESAGHYANVKGRFLAM